MRIARFLANCGIASRRQSEKLIERGEISVNGRILKSPAVNIDPAADTVKWKGKPVKPAAGKYYALNKPSGYTCSSRDKHAEQLITELFPKSAPRLFTVGRLDKNSEGLILCTNDGDFAEKIAHPRYQIPKCYNVTVSGTVSRDKMKRLCRGVKEEGELLQAIEADIAEQRSSEAGKSLLRITVTEGKKREIRRMCEVSGWRVHRLVRVRIGPLSLNDLKPGQIRELSEQEYRQLLNSAAAGA